MEPLIGIRGLTFGYGRTAVLEDVSLDILEKDYVLVIGPNGGGKTTLLKLILGILKPWSGTISFQADVAGRIGYVPQHLPLDPSAPITVLDFFAGSGTAGEAAARNGRDFILIDDNPAAIAVMKKRLAFAKPELVKLGSQKGKR